MDIIAITWNGGRANKNFAQAQAYTDINMLRDARDFMAKRCYLISQQLGYVIKQEYMVAIPNITSELTTVMDLPQEVEYA